VLGDEKLKELARILVGRVRENATIDWSVRESTRAKMRVMVKRLLSQYGYPPDAQELATDTVIKQAELLAGEDARQP
jgi:type I restriction enzyme R subunit